jgi:hypothetical protein
VVNNLFINNGVFDAGSGDAMALVGPLPGQETLLAHNTIVSGTTALDSAVVITGVAVPAASGVVTASYEVHNNIFVNAAVGIEATIPGVTADHNLYYSVTVPVSGTAPGSGNVFADPRFVDAADGNFRIRIDSPARDAGRVTSVANDFEGDPRPQDAGFDIGMDEGGTPIPPEFTTSPPLTGTVGVVYVYDANASGVPTPTYSLINGPSGITVNSVTGLVQFTPPAPGAYTMTIRATNAGGTVDQSWTVNVPEPPGPEERAQYLPLVRKNP